MNCRVLSKTTSAKLGALWSIAAPVHSRFLLRIARKFAPSALPILPINAVAEGLTAKGYKFVSAQIEMVPQNYVTMTGEDDVKSMNKLIDMLEDNEDVQNVWHNWQQD